MLRALFVTLYALFRKKSNKEKKKIIKVEENCCIKFVSSLKKL